MGEYEGTFNGFTFGAGARPGASVASLTNWAGRKGTVVVTESTSGGGHIGRMAAGPKQVRLGFNLHASTPAELQDLVDEAVYRFDVGSQVLPLTIGGRIMFVTPVDIDVTLDPSWPGPERTTDAAVLFQAGDPGLYSPETDLPFGAGGGVSSADLTFENLGKRTTRAWRAWRLKITPHGTVKAPYIKHMGTGQIVTWAGLTVPPGQLLTVGDYRVSRLGSQRVDGYRRTGSSEFPDWPVLQPGTNVIRVGCASGLISGNLWPRSTF